MISPPLFDENWITYDEDNEYNVLNKNYSVNGKTVEATLTDILSLYISADSAVNFVAADVTDVKTPFIEGVNLIESMIIFAAGDYDSVAVSITSMKIAVTHKTVNGRTYALAVVIAEK